MVKDKQKKSLTARALDKIEIAGNKLPDPIIIFIMLCVIILVISFIAAMLGVSAVNPANGETVNAINLLTKEGLARMLEEAVPNFSAFPPLGMVLVVMLGVGIAEKTGYFEVLMRYTIEKAPKKLIIPVIIFVAILGNAAGDAAPIVLPPIAAMVFIKLGYHPIAGLVMAYAASLGGFAASILVGLSDALVLGFTDPAAAMIDETVQTNAIMNYYFLFASTFLLLVVAWFVTTKITIPRFGSYDNLMEESNKSEDHITDKERKGMLFANISIVISLIIVALLAIPKDGLLRNAETGSLLVDSPLLNGGIVVVTIIFIIPGIIYGITAGTMKTTKEFSQMLTDSMSTMSSFIVIVFFAAQMLAYFSWSNLGTIMAIKGAELLEGQNGVVLIIGILILTATVNLVMGSASAKWAILAPILVPMMMLLGYHPAFTQIIYRVGDSITNPITPMMVYMPLLLSFAQRYDKNIGLGTLIAALIPYSVAFGIFWTLLLIVWFLFGIPIGPGGPIYL